MRQSKQVGAVVVVWALVAGCTVVPYRTPPERPLTELPRQAAVAPTEREVQLSQQETVAQTEREAQLSWEASAWAARETQLEERVQELEAQLKAVAPVLEAARRMQAAAEHASACQAADAAWQQWLLAAHTARGVIGTPRFLDLVYVAAQREAEARRLSEQVVEFSRLLGGRLCLQPEEASAPETPKVRRVRR